MTKPDTKIEVEKLIKGYISFSGKSPVEVIFSGGVNDTVAVLPWYTFVTVIEALLASSQDSFRRKVKDGIDEYFEGLIMIPNPQATKESLKKSLQIKLKTI